MRHFLFCFSALALFAQNTDLDQALQPSRQRINTLDGEIVKLLNERAQVVHEVGLIKKRYHAQASAPGREEQVVQRASEQARAPLTASAVQAIYKTILHEMSAMEQAEIDKSANPQ